MRFTPPISRSPSASPVSSPSPVFHTCSKDRSGSDHSSSQIPPAHPGKLSSQPISRLPRSFPSLRLATVRGESSTKTRLTGSATPTATLPVSQNHPSRNNIEMSDSVPPAGEAPVEHLNIKVTDNNNEVFFKIKRSTQLKKLMDAFCDRQGKQLSTVRFLFDGTRVRPEDTPDTLEMADGDTLEVHQEQIGG
ncbi:SUMO family protein SMT3 [Aspergillus affinis]|uniref:SUMO family protein SMT3 n=1 Tax=Aspergillus affinis TaxID=1070780 RepID=UPI0022FE22C5|nr:putative ubiquitin-like modifier [Aspergillus affinis]KAI9038732.1 putative ubiquitin-like modifier [Aspergillus affinis]